MQLFLLLEPAKQREPPPVLCIFGQLSHADNIFCILLSCLE